jgi:hypothetical protein
MLTIGSSSVIDSLKLHINTWIGQPVGQPYGCRVASELSGWLSTESDGDRGHFDQSQGLPMIICWFLVG